MKGSSCASSSAAIISRNCAESSLRPGTWIARATQAIQVRPRRRLQFLLIEAVQCSQQHHPWLLGSNIEGKYRKYHFSDPPRKRQPCRIMSTSQIISICRHFEPLCFLRSLRFDLQLGPSRVARSSPAPSAPPPPQVVIPGRGSTGLTFQRFIQKNDLI